MMRFFYLLFTQIYPVIIRMASLFSPKAKLWIQGRKNIFEKIQNAVNGNQAPIIWMHCASLGEFEQGRPIIEKIKTEFPNYKICVTFFSPSGYEIRKNYAQADYIFYLPMDSAKNARHFLEILQPKMAFFVKYEFWHFYIQELKNRQISTFSISTLLRADQIYFKSNGGFYRNILKNISYFFVQNQSTVELLRGIQINNCTLSGDTRYDRVSEIAANWTPVAKFENLPTNKKVLVAGSIWKEDDAQLADFINAHSEYFYILAPHEIKESRIQECQRNYQHSILYSEIKNNIPSDKNVLIIDNIGMLNRLYRYADIAYIGGAWGHDGIHNILEAAVYGKPVLYGPNHPKSFEATALVDFGGGFSAQNKKELETKLSSLLTDDAMRLAYSQKAAQFVAEQRGATQIIWEYIFPILQQIQ